MKSKTYLLKKENISNYLCFSGVGIFDFIKFFKNYNGDTYFYSDLPTNFYDDNSVTLSSVKPFELTPTFEKTAIKACDSNDFDYYRNAKKLGIEQGERGTGDSLIIKLAPDCSMIGFTASDIRSIFETGIMPTGISAICLIHDYSWRAVCCFNSFATTNEVIDFVKSNSNLTIVDSEDQLPK